METPKTKPMNIYQKINACMKEAQYVTKEKAGKGLNYSFASHDKVTALLRPVFITNGIAVLPSVVSHECEVLNGTNARGEPKQTIFTRVSVAVEFVDIDNPADLFEVHSYGYGLDTQDKGVGKAISYAVKYAMLKVLCLETGDDPERDNIDYDHKPVEENPITKAQACQIEEWIDETKSDLKKFCKHFGVKLVDEIKESQYADVESLIAQKKEKIKAEAKSA